MKNSGSKLICSVMAVAAVGVAGCASSGSNGGGGNRTALYASDVGYQGQALASGKTLTAQQNMSRAATLDGNTADSTNAGFSIKQNSSGGYDVTVGGQTESFASGNQNGASGYQKANNGLYNQSMTLSQMENGSSYSSLWAYYFNTPTSSVNGYAVTGTETEPSAVAARTATATYVGNATADSYDKATGDTARTHFEGTIALDANFDSNRISGEIYDIHAEELGSNGQPVPGGFSGNLMGGLDLEETAISGNGYSGSATGYGADLAGNDGNYTGKFYGPAAEETAGTLLLEDSDTVTVGGFHAER